MKHVDWKSKIRFENVGWKMSKVTFQLSLSPDTARYTGSQTTRQESKTYCASNGRIQLPNRMNFGKLYCNFFIMDMVAFMQGGIGQIVSVNINQCQLISVYFNKPWNYSPFYQFYAQKADILAWFLAVTLSSSPDRKFHCAWFVILSRFLYSLNKEWGYSLSSSIFGQGCRNFLLKM